MKKEIIIVAAVLIIIFVICIYLFLENNTLKVTKYEIEKNNLPKSFDGYKIAHISDFHNTRSNKLKNSILSSLEKEKPDILVITGDLIDSYHTDINISKEFIENIKDIPIYFVAGNHESRIEEYKEFKETLKELGVTVLENEMISLTKAGHYINLIGLQDPTFETGENNMDEITTIVDNYLKKFAVPNNFDILLLHRPELLDVYAQNDIDVVFSGHAHGGQFIIPFIGPIVAPNQGLFPKLTSGVHTKDNTHLVISRGIGNSRIPYRINNNPELIYVTLKQN